LTGRVDWRQSKSFLHVWGTFAGVSLLRIEANPSPFGPCSDDAADNDDKGDDDDACNNVDGLAGLALTRGGAGAKGRRPRKRRERTTRVVGRVPGARLIVVMDGCAVPESESGLQLLSDPPVSARMCTCRGEGHSVGS